jgi:hypothetical protein
MFPGFTAQAALAANGITYRATGIPVGEHTSITPQQRMLEPDQVAPGRGGGEPATTCTCPCCQTVNGRLVCC